MRRHSGSRKPIENWLMKVKAAKWTKYADIKKTFNSVDKNGEDFIFDIAGNKYRLIAIVEFEETILKIKALYTHEEYNKKYNRGK